ncbi:ATP-binding protein [Desulfovibrio inopinatus]|uniref:ATP-binding protein n=1 Tax=Desulfovibrio inopinatus TaxID=102109 RepID=UPI00040AAF19|nr:ATP-binding protein [Desulfovibrio inopinatus]
MTQKRSGPQTLSRLREKAERLLSKLPNEESTTQAEDFRELLHELNVYQIELELQNEELINMQTQLEHSRDRYIRLFDFAPVGYFSFNNKGVILDVNLAGSNMLGVNRMYLHNKPLVTYLEPASQIIFSMHLHAVMASHDAVHTCELVFKSRKDRRVIAKVQSLNSTAGNCPPQCLSVFMNITDMRQAERDLRRSKAELDTMFEETLSPIAVLDNTGQFLNANRQAAKFFETSRENLRESNLKRFCPFEFKPSALVGLPFPIGESVEFEYIVGSKTKTMLQNLIPICHENEDTTIYYVIGQDITERKRMEHELRRAKEAAESISLAKSNFLANMSHEIRTPMNAIMGMTKMVLESNLHAEQRTMLEGVCEASHSLLEIINDILDFSKIEAGKVELKPEEFDPRTVIDATMRVFRIPAEKSGLELTATYAPDVPTQVYGDFGRLRQILVNLVGNALKFTPKGSVEINVSQLMPKTSACSNAATLLFSVKDTGIGIPTEKFETIFDSFTQEDSTTTKRYGGTGLGLAISKRLVEMMNGSIWLESTVDVGSTFYFTVTFETPDNVMPIRPETSAASLQSSVPPLRILLAEDNLLNQRFASHCLRSKGHAVTAVPNGKEALDVLRQDEFDVILMDVSMPVLDGIETTRAIRADQSGQFDPTIPIIALTAHAVKGDRERFLEAGMDDYVSKPFDLDVLFEVIAKCLPKSARQIPFHTAESMPVHTDTIFDAQWISSKFSAKYDFYNEIFEMFIEDAGEKLHRVRGFLGDNAFEAISDEAHSLKGMSATIGAARFRTASQELEAAARQKQLDEARQRFVVLEDELSRLRNLNMDEATFEDIKNGKV